MFHRRTTVTCERLGCHLEYLEDRIALTAELLLDFNTTELRLEPRLMTAFKDQLYFVRGDSDTQHIELWRTDGSPDGTELVKLVVADDGAPIRAVDMLPIGDRLFILARDPGLEITLYESDGTAEGTRRIPGLNPARGWSTGGLEPTTDGRAWFSYNDDGGLTIVTTDGTAEGSARSFYFLSSAVPLAINDIGALFLNSRSQATKLLFRGLASDEWTVVSTFDEPERVPSHVALPESFYFLDGESDGLSQLWQVDSEGIAVAVTNATEVIENSLAQDGDRVVYLRPNEDGGIQIWSLSDSSDDGSGIPVQIGTVTDDSVSIETTEFGPVLITHEGDASRLHLIGESAVFPVPTPNVSRILAASKSQIFYETIDAGQSAVWRTDGTKAGTSRVAELTAGAHDFAAVGGVITFKLPEDDRQLWSFGGSGLIPLFESEDLRFQNGSSTIHSVQVVDDSVVLTIEKGLNDFPISNYARWHADIYVSNDQGTRPLVDETFEWGHHFGWPNRPLFYKVDGDHYFAGHLVTQDWDMWRTDFTPEGTTLFGRDAFQQLQPSLTEDFFGFYDLNARQSCGDGNFQFDRFCVPILETSNGSWVVARNSANTRELYRLLNGKPELVMELPKWPSSNWKAFVHADEIYFLVENELGQYELWRSNGTSEGTSNVLTADGILPVPLETERLYLQVRNDGQAGEVWSISTDGTLDVHNIGLGANGSSGVFDTVVLGTIRDSLFLVADDSVHGREVWAIHPDGTTQLFDIHAGPESSDPLIGWRFERLSQNLVDDAIFFVADDGVHGRELWVADADGVRLERDIRPGPAGSWPSILTGHGNRVLFHANDGVHGRELWEARTDAVFATDADGDGLPTVADFLILQRHFGQQTDKGAEEGDFNGDGIVDVADFLVFSRAMRDV